MQDVIPDIFGLSVALAVGLLIGIERERNKGEGQARAAAGVRTFILVALAGALADRIGAIGIAVGGIFIALAALASYRRSSADDPGLTTEVAMLVTYFLGIIAMTELRLAAALGVVVAVVLASKSGLHRFTRETLTEQEMHDGLLLAAAAMVILPLLPDRSLDPWQALNPRKLWMLVVIVMAINAAGYVALRALGPRKGLALAGLAGGFVSSTATIAAMGDRARTAPELLPLCVSAALFSNIATMIQIAIVVGALSPPLLQRLALPLAAATLAAIGAAAFARWRSGPAEAKIDAIAIGRPFEPKHALIFVAIVGAILLLSSIVHHWLGNSGLLVAAAVSGFADVHAASASVAQLVGANAFTPEDATLPVLAAVITNSTSKLVMALLRGGAGYALRLLPGIALMVMAFAAALWLPAIR